MLDNFNITEITFTSNEQNEEDYEVDNDYDEITYQYNCLNSDLPDYM